MAPQTLQQVVRALGGRSTLSVALGELLEFSEDLLALVQQHPVSFVKVGLAGCASLPSWPQRLCQLRQLLPSQTQLVAAAYADASAVNAPCPTEVFQVLLRQGLKVFMLDTARKDGRRLWDHLPTGQVTQLAAQARAQGMEVVLAGSLQVEDIPLAKQCGATIVGFRSAACRNGRFGSLCPELLKRLWCAVEKQNRTRRTNGSEGVVALGPRGSRLPEP